MLSVEDSKRERGAHRDIVWALFTLLALVTLCAFTAGGVLPSAKAHGGILSGTQLPPGFPNQTGEDIKKEFDDDDLKVKEEKPRGKWGFGLVPDMSQFNDSSVPVVVGGIQTLSGGEKYMGVTKIKRLELRNRNLKAVNSVQLRWTVSSLDDREKVLSEGTTQFVNLWVEANSSQVIEIPTLYPALFLKPLAKDGELQGRFLLTIGIQEARFADGSFWRR